MKPKSNPIAGENVGLMQLQNENEWEIQYGCLKLGVPDDYSCTIKV